MAASADCAMLMPDLALSLESVSETLCDLRHRIEHIEHVQRTNDRRLEDQIRLTIQGTVDNDLKEKTRACAAELQAELEDILSVELTRRLTEFEEMVRMSVNPEEDSTPELKSANSKNSSEASMPDLLAESEEEVEDVTEWVGRVLRCVQIRSETCPAKAMETNGSAEDSLGTAIKSQVSHDAVKVDTPNPDGRQQIEMARHDSIRDDVLPSDPHHGVKALTSLALPSRHVRLPQQLGTSSATSQDGRQALGTLTTGATFESFDLANVLADASKAKGLSDSGRHCPGNLVVRRRSSSVPERRKVTSQVDVAVEPQGRLPGQRDACCLPATQLSPRPSPSQSPWQMRRSIPASQRSPRPSPSQAPRQIRRSMPIVPRSSLCMPGQLKAVPCQFTNNPDFQMPQHVSTTPLAVNHPMPLLMQAGYTHVVAANTPAKRAVSMNHCSV
eukprot:TRINITY_DN23623_c0_g2_i2.p1 TRINITY_DN23623_c0_g2~~TRINITY_DN23623_c0_g2_i2.p1  ORF type:complete len:444 (-),score=66.20 TRINITY_DN23623_c0_g2_i2:18-1349(-)